MPGGAQRLRELLEGPEPALAPFVYDGLQARLAQQAGFELVYMTGFGTAMSLGMPDVGLLSMSEMLANLRPLAAAKSPLANDRFGGKSGHWSLRTSLTRARFPLISTYFMAQTK